VILRPNLQYTHYAKTDTVIVRDRLHDQFNTTEPENFKEAFEEFSQTLSKTAEKVGDAWWISP
jgi:hypothetical protein